MAAVLARCSIFPPKHIPKPCAVLWRPSATLLPHGNPSPEFIDGTFYKNKMLLSKTSMRVQVLYKSSQDTSSSKSMNLKQDVQMVVLEEALRFAGKFSNFYNVFLEDISDHKRLAGSIAKILLIANVSMMILPFNALADTCQTDNSIYNMPLAFAVAMIGATVGGLLARQRKEELARLNDQLRQINAALRRQAKIESYAPNLSYAPVGRTPETEVIVDPRKEQMISNLRMGKNYLRNQDPEKAFVEFKAGFDLAESLGDQIEKKKAARGLGASLQRQGKYREAIKYHSKVLEIAQKTGEDSGSTEAYGAIADCYTELGDLEKAGKFYDKYIARLEKD